MARQDKTGVKYEAFVVQALESLGFTKDQVKGRNYIAPSKNSKIVIPNTYIQPDVVLRNNSKITAIIYVTHWNRQRNSSFKFWRTWEEFCQQQVALPDNFLSINCIFEALPDLQEPSIYINSDQIPLDKSRNQAVPLGFNGWYPALSWSLVECFDVTAVFPLGYNSIFSNSLEEQDIRLFQKILNQHPKKIFESHHKILKEKFNYVSKARLQSSYHTHSRYRIGILHVYIFYKIFQKKTIESFSLSQLFDFLLSLDQHGLSSEALSNLKLLKGLQKDEIVRILKILSQIRINTGDKPKYLCEFSIFSSDVGNDIIRLKLNADLKICLQDIILHIKDSKFIECIQKSFNRFDNLILGSDEAFDDILDPILVANKENFVRSNFPINIVLDKDHLSQILLEFSDKNNSARSNISNHSQNWILEMLLYLLNIDLSEDVYSNITRVFEESGHQLRPHTPYGDDTVLVLYLLQGKDICEHWSDKGKKRTLTQSQFYKIAWDSIAKCIVNSFNDKGGKSKSSQEIVRDYINNKIMKIIGSSINGFHVIIDFFLGDICSFTFTNNKDPLLQKRLCASWQTDIINKLWNGRPLETWMDGVSKNSQWLIKSQSAPNNPGDKTKELAGRCRALRIGWSHGEDPRNRDEWSFYERDLPKLALVLDGDWSVKQKQNLYEAGWDWVGDVSQLGELRQLIQADDPIQ